MKFYNKFYVDCLYYDTSLDESNDSERVYLVMPHGFFLQEEQISFEDAMQNYNTSFVFTPKKFLINSIETATDFIEKIYDIVARSSSPRLIIWLADPDDTDNFISVSLRNNGTSIVNDLIINLTERLLVRVVSGTNIKIVDNKLKFENKDITNYIGFFGSLSPVTSTSFDAFLSFENGSLGRILFKTYIKCGELFNKLKLGFEIFYASNDKNYEKYIPFMEIKKSCPEQNLGFFVSVNPFFNYISDNKTYLAFFESNLQLKFSSYYRTIFNDVISLSPISISDNINPSHFVISKTLNNLDVILSPEGDFIMNNESTHNCYLLCGIEGTEFLRFNQGDILRFYFEKPAFAQNYPIQSVSPFSAPFDSNESPLNNTYITSWATIISSSEIGYVAQPKGSAVYGVDRGELLSHQIPELVLRNEQSYPLFPYAGVNENKNEFDIKTLEEIERCIIATTRKDVIAKAGAVLSTRRLNVNAINDELYLTTPSGLIMCMSNNQYTGIYLAQIKNQSNNYLERLYFENPSDKLVSAFQTSNLFLIIANPDNLGSFTSYNSAYFHNHISIQDWNFRINVGTENKYNNYKSVMIVKGCKGKIYDPVDDSQCLVANPGLWTQKTDFASPRIIGKEDIDHTQLTVLSDWIMNYMDSANNQSDKEYFGNFNKIVQDPNWQGILFLNIGLNKDDLPDSLSGLLSGVSDPENFTVHHLGLTINQIKKDGGKVSQNDDSALFGLIYFADNNFIGDVVSPNAGRTGPYDFKLLTLKVLFENSSVKNFQSYAQITLNNILGMSVDKMGISGNIYNTVLLRGSCQDDNGTPVYTMQSVTDNEFYFNSNVINKFQITNLKMLTVSKVDNIYRFALEGFIDFKLLKIKNEDEFFDVFSFGNDLNEDNNRTGLYFSNMDLKMTDINGEVSFSFEPADATFDVSLSYVRSFSVYKNLCLQIEKLCVSSGQTPTDEWLNVLTKAPIGGISSKEWYGLQYVVNMGTIGELAGKLSLTAHMLIAWTPNSRGENYEVFIGIKLPGSGNKSELISIQNIISLSTDQIWLSYDKKRNSFFLMLTDIALKFLGLLKLPPNGSTNFYVFGNPNSTADSNELGWFAMYKKK